MTDQQQHPITPPQWKMDAWQARIETMGADVPSILLEVSQWGYDQRGEVDEAKLQKARNEELDACCEWLEQQELCSHRDLIPSLRAARRPKPPSLKEQALALLDPSNTYGSITQEEEYRISVANADTIRRALEALPND